MFSPYLDTLGGGEKYVASLVKLLLDNGCEVDIFWKDESLVEQISARYQIDLKGARIFPVGFSVSTSGTKLEKFRLERNYDFLFFASDGSIPTLFAKKNVIHFQVPFKNVHGRSLVNQVKMTILVMMKKTWMKMMIL